MVIYSQQSEEKVIRQQINLFTDLMFKEYIYRISLEETYINRRIKGIQIGRKVDKLEEDSNHEYLYKYNPKERKVVKSTTIVGETQKFKRTPEVEVDTNLEIETRLVAGIKTLLDIIFITLQTRRESN